MAPTLMDGDLKLNESQIKVNKTRMFHTLICQLIQCGLRKYFELCRWINCKYLPSIIHERDPTLPDYALVELYRFSVFDVVCFTGKNFWLLIVVSLFLFQNWFHNNRFWRFQFGNKIEADFFVNFEWRGCSRSPSFVFPFRR